MAVERIELQRTEQSENVTIALRLLRDACDRLDYAKAVMNASIDTSASPADYTTLERLFGVPEGAGPTVYNLIAGVDADLNSYNVSSAIARLA